jgi:polar amino acid transport system substrate-binding protein
VKVLPLFTVVVLSVALLIGSAMAVAGDELNSKKPLKVAVNSPGSFPYLYFDETTQEYQGVVRELLNAMESELGYSIDYIDSNQLRSEEFLSNAKVDMLVISPQWLQKPDRFIYSDTIIEHETYLYSITPFPQNFSLETVTEKTVCTQKRYVYSGLTSFFKNGGLRRIDSTSQPLMAAMLIANRCDFAVLNNYNAWNAFSKPANCNATIYQSPRPTSNVSLHVALRAALAPVKRDFDRIMSRYKSNGALEKLVSKHSLPVSFPKKPNC